jgi:hypothetical protein
MIKVRTIPVSARVSAVEEALCPGVTWETWPSIPLILLSTATAACLNTPLYLGQFEAKSAVRVHSP